MNFYEHKPYIVSTIGFGALFIPGVIPKIAGVVLIVLSYGIFSMRMKSRKTGMFRK